jgi:ABC-type transport system involved in multi-copper enzyme maturation permease subunit
MIPTLTIAALTFREAVRRRVAAIVSTLSLVLVGLIAWGFWKLNGAIPNHEGAIAADAALTILLAFMFSVVLGIGAAFLAAGSIASEIDSGIALAVLPRAISRAEFVAGKWLGLVSLVIAYAAVFGTLAFLAIGFAAGYEAPHPFGALLYVVAQSIALLSLALSLSTRLPALAGSVLSVGLFGVSWIAGITAGIARALHADTLQHVASAVGLLMPTDGLWRGAVFDLTPVLLQVASANQAASSVNPFGASGAPSEAFLIWCVAWVAAVFGGCVWSMRTRDL